MKYRFLKYSLSVVCMFAVSAMAQNDVSDSETSAANLLEKADSYYRQHAPDSALFVLWQYMELQPMDAEAYYLEGKIYFDAKNYEKAVSSFSKVLFLQADAAKAYNDRGSAYRMMKAYNKALADYDEAIRLQPKAVYYNNRASVLMKLEDFEAAIADYNQACALDSTYYIALNNRGLAYMKTADFELAVDDFTACIRLNPSYYQAYTNRGIAYYKLREFEKSLSDFDKVVSLNPNGMAYLHRGNIKDMLEDKAGACEDWSRAEALGVKSASESLKFINCK